MYQYVNEGERIYESHEMWSRGRYWCPVAINLIGGIYDENLSTYKT